MTPEQKAAFMIAQSVAAFAEIAGMQAFNQNCVLNGASVGYNEGSFIGVIDRYGLSQNALLTFFQPQ